MSETDKLVAYASFAEKKVTFSDEWFRLPCKVNPVKNTLRGPYGAKIPTQYMVLWRNRWRRVYCAQWGNASSHYVGSPGDWDIIIQCISEESSNV
jgi:hypothetical protein